MTQRIFDVDNPQDVKDLFDILPNNIVKIKWVPTNKVDLFDNCGLKSSTGLFCIAWRNKTEITRPVDESRWIGKLCWFADDAGDEYIGVLHAIYNGDDSYPYVCKNNLLRAFKDCRPVRRDEVQFADDAESKE